VIDNILGLGYTVIHYSRERLWPMSGPGWVFKRRDLLVITDKRTDMCAICNFVHSVNHHLCCTFRLKHSLKKLKVFKTFNFIHYSYKPRMVLLCTYMWVILQATILFDPVINPSSRHPFSPVILLWNQSMLP